jgi:hypothetical protein
MLKDSPKAVPMTKKGNIPFGEADLAAIALTSVLMTWQNQYNLNRSTVLESTCTFLLDLEAIERVMVEKHNKKLKAKNKASTARPKAKINPKCKASGLELYTILILAAWPVLVLIYHILVLVNWYFGRYFEH